MTVKFDARPEAERQIVSVRPVTVAELEQDLQDEIGPVETVYAVHRPDGARVALVRDRGLAFALARQNDLTPVNVH